MFRGLRRFALDALARGTNWGLTTLRNGVELGLTRDEIRFSRISFSQFGEDLAILEFVDEDPSIPPVYVDVGCFHPIHHSNTLLLHKRGWRGMNIDLQAAKIRQFETLRPRDINLVAACSDRERDMRVQEYGAGVTDQLAPNDAPTLLSVFGQPPTSSTPIRTTTLNQLLRTHGIGRIGYLNIDCEGHDLEVLRGLDVVRHAPAIIGIEVPLNGDDALAGYLNRFGYYCRRTYYRTQLYVLRRPGL